MISEVYDQSWPRSLSPEISSISFGMRLTDGEAWLTLHTPEWVDEEHYDGLTVDLRIPGPNMNEMRACAEHNALFVKSPDKISSEFKEEMKDGMLEPVYHDKDDIMAKIFSNIITSSQDISVKHTWAYFGNRFSHLYPSVKNL